MTRHKTTVERRIFKAGFVVLIAHLLFKVAGLIQAKVMGHCLPQLTFDVVYSFAFENCIFTFALIASEAFAPAFLPVFMREMESVSEESSWQFANTVLTLLVGLFTAAAVVLFFAPGWVTQLLTHWSPTSSPEKYELAVQGVRTLGPAVIGLSIGSITYVMLNGYKRFFLAAFGDAVWKFVVVAFLLGAVFLRGDSAKLLMWGVVVGSLCKVVTHLYGLRDKLHYLRPTVALSQPAFRQLCWLVLPLLVGILMAKLRDMVNNVYILSTLEQSGLIQANSMGRKLQSTLLFLIPYTLSIAVFPFFCELVDKQDHDGLGKLVTRFGRMLLSVFAPFALFVAVAALPFTSLIFRGGFFDATAVERTAVSLACYTFVLPAAAIETLVMQAYFANRRMWTVTLIGVVFSVLSILLSWVGLKFFAAHELWLLAFIAGGFTVSRMLKCVTLVEMLKKNAPVFPMVETTLFFLRVAGAAGLASGAAWFVLYRFTPVAGLVGRVGDLLKLGVAGALFGVVYLVAAWLLRIDEVRELFGILLTRTGGRRPTVNG